MLLFGFGLLANLVPAPFPTPDMRRMLDTASRKAGLAGMGYAIQRGTRDAAA